MDQQVLDNKIYTVKSNKSDNISNLIILKEKKVDIFRICNVTKGHICPCKFDTYREAEKDIFKYEADGKIQILSK